MLDLNNKAMMQFIQIRPTKMQSKGCLNTIKNKIGVSGYKQIIYIDYNNYNAMSIIKVVNIAINLTFN